MNSFIVVALPVMAVIALAVALARAGGRRRPLSPEAQAQQDAADSYQPRVQWGSGRRTDHRLHLFLTVLTCGAWLPIWLLVDMWNTGNRTRNADIARNG